MKLLTFKRNGSICLESLVGEDVQNPNLAFERYIDGAFRCEDGSLDPDTLALLDSRPMVWRRQGRP